jgi:hypothetical protein
MCPKLLAKLDLRDAMRLPHRRQFLHPAAGAAALPAVSRIAWGQGYPSRPVHWITGFSAGSVATSLRASRRNGCPSASANNSRGESARRTRQISPLRPTGTRSCSWCLERHQRDPLRKTHFQFRPHIAPVAAIASQPHIVVINLAVPAKTIPEFIAYAKANPGKINMASGGNGTTSHLAGELFKSMTGINLVHVPYRGEAGALTELIGGPGANLLRVRHGVARTHQVRQASVSSGHHNDALEGAAGPFDRGRFRAGLRGEQLDWSGRAKRHACGNH